MEAKICQTEGNRESSYGWVVVASGLIITLIIYGIIASMAVFFKPLLLSFQWSRGQTSLIWAANWVTFGVLSLFIDPLTDRFGAKPAIAGFLCVQGLGLLVFLRPDQLWLIYLGAVLWGMAQGGPMTCYPMLYREYFGERHLATVMTGLFALVGLGMALGGLLGGIIYDATDGYQLSFAISLSAVLGAALIATTLQPPHSSWVGERRG